MSTVAVDVIVELNYTVSSDRFCINTNAKREKVQELLSEFIRAQIGAGEDPRPAEQKDQYTIRLGLELSDDAWHSWNDCGNLGLRDGIILHAMKILDESFDKITWMSNPTWIKLRRRRHE